MVLGFREKPGIASSSGSIPDVLLHKNSGIFSKLPLEFHFSLENTAWREFPAPGSGTQWSGMLENGILPGFPAFKPWFIPGFPWDFPAGNSSPGAGRDGKGFPRDDTAWSDPKRWKTGIFSQPGERCSHPGFFLGILHGNSPGSGSGSQLQDFPAG